MIRFDAEAFRRLNNLAGKFPAVDAVGVFCARYLVIIMFAAVLVRTFFALKRPDTRDLAALLEAADARAAIAGMLAFVGNWLFSLLFFRPRPFVALKGVHLLVPPPISPHSFPSSHSSVAFALAFSMLFVDLPFGLVLLVCATAVAFGRVYVGVHYPLDVIVGIFVGLFWALTVQFVGTWMHDVEYFAALSTNPLKERRPPDMSSSMKAIILAGGGGSRLWPVSRKNSPKQVQPIIGDLTLLRATYARVRKGFAAKDIFVATAEAQKDLVRAELPALPKENLILEPCRRDTASAIGYALLHVARRDPDALFVTVNSDAYVRDAEEYHRVLRAAAAAVEAKPEHTALVGIAPTYPETGYGYIRLGAPMLEVTEDGKRYDALEVGRFVEKPDLPTAERYLLEGGYLWNPTLIVGSVRHFLSLYDKHLPVHASIFAQMEPILLNNARSAEKKRLFARLPSVSIDYGILEKEEDLLVIPADFAWADIGHWRAVRDILAADPDADVIKGTHVGIDSSGNLIYGFSGKLVATAGVKDMIIIETEDAILVCPKDHAQDVKKIVGALEGDRALQKYL